MRIVRKVGHLQRNLVGREGSIRQMIAFLVLQTLIGLGPFTATWDSYNDPVFALSDVTLQFYVDDAPVASIPAALASTSQDFTLKTFGQHSVMLTAKSATAESDKTKSTVLFRNDPQANDPACNPPLGTHAPAVFPTTLTVTTGKAGSPAAQNFLVTAPDPVVELAVQIDGKDVQPIGTGSDLRAFTGLRFTTPLPGTHTMGIRVLTAFGCTLVRSAAPLVVKP